MKHCDWCGQQVENRYVYQSELVCKDCLVRNHVRAIDNVAWQAAHGWQKPVEVIENA